MILTRVCVCGFPSFNNVFIHVAALKKIQQHSSSNSSWQLKDESESFSWNEKGDFSHSEKRAMNVMLAHKKRELLFCQGRRRHLPILSNFQDDDWVLRRSMNVNVHLVDSSKRLTAFCIHDGFSRH